MRVTVLGASGFVGHHVTRALRRRGDEVRTASLRDPIHAAGLSADCDAIVNLAGESLSQHWSPRVKDAILTSRTEQPRALLENLRARSGHRPSIYVSASAIGYYGSSDSATFTEESPPGSDFLAQVCVQWEAVAMGAADLGMRVACVRSGLVLGKGGGLLARMLPVFKLGGGGVIGTGRQWMSWVHVDDLVAIYLLALDGLSGAINATAPNPVTNEAFTRTLGQVLNRPTRIPTPTFVLRAMLGEGADMALSGQRVLPERAQTLGFNFHYPAIDAALQNVVG